MELYLIYDGDGILCSNTAKAMQIKQSVGQLEIINARMSHPLVTEALNKGYDLNEGILVKYNNTYYLARCRSFSRIGWQSIDFV